MFCRTNISGEGENRTERDTLNRTYSGIGAYADDKDIRVGNYIKEGGNTRNRNKLEEKTIVEGVTRKGKHFGRINIIQEGGK